MKKFFKKPLNVVSLLLAVLGIIGIIVMLVAPHGRTYTRKAKEGDTTVVSYIVLKDGEVYRSTKVGDGERTKDISAGEYTISDGEIKSISVYGDINAFKLTTAVGDVEYKCNMTITFFVIACAMTVVGLAGTVYGAVAGNKKKAPAKKKK